MPDNTTDVTSAPPDRYTYTADKYLNVSGSGAEKLIDSGIAPLVAAARGYETVTSDPTDIKDSARRLGLGALRSGRGFMLKFGAEQGDVMVIPLFDARTAYKGAKHDRRPGATSFQFRPSSPVLLSGAEKASKYLFAKGESIPLDVHPALPLSWFDNPQRVLISEGTIKTDSFLTATLVAAGVDEATLNDTSSDPTERLRTILDGLPTRYWTMPVSFAGVGNWHSNPEWTDVPIPNREVWVAFDKDVDSNPHVWAQASQLFAYIEKKKGIPKIVDLHVNGSDEPLGLDDFLAEHGTWNDLTHRLIEDLPARPPVVIKALPGAWRMNDEIHSAEELVATTSPSGQATLEWEPKVPIAGRIKRRVTRRIVTKDEQTSGEVGPTVADGADMYDDLELVWEDSATNEIHNRVVTVPNVAMAMRPADWARQKFWLPGELNDHPAWPPDPKWLAALKGHKTDEIEVTTEWEHSGYVPAADGTGWRFIVSNQVIGPRGFAPGDAVPGITTDHIANIESYGVQFPEDDDQLRADIVRVLDVLVDGGAFAMRGLGVLALAAGLRPIVPLEARTPILVTGPPASGKSYWASMPMMFWQPRPGTWTEDELPGNLKSTRAAIQAEQARCVIRVYDDNAPSPSRAQVETELVIVDDIIRGFYNKASRGRMTAQMEVMPALRPRALPIVTAENPLPVDSLMQRTIHYRFRKGSLSESTKPTERLNQMRDNDGAPARIAGALIAYTIRLIDKDGWVGLNEKFKVLHSELNGTIYNQMGGQQNQTRGAKAAADMSLSLMLLRFMCDDLGIPEVGERVANMVFDLVELVEEHVSASDVTSPGASLIRALRSVLSSGAGHISDPNGSLPKLPGDVLSERFSSTQFGWASDADGRWTPKGARIGYLAEVKGLVYVFFDAQAAFSTAQRAYSHLIPYGATQTTAWNSAWDDGIAGGHYAELRRKKQAESRKKQKRKTGSTTALESTGSVTVSVRVGSSKDDGGSRALRGVPVLIEKLFPPPDEDDDDVGEVDVYDDDFEN